MGKPSGGPFVPVPVTPSGFQHSSTPKLPPIVPDYPLPTDPPPAPPPIVTVILPNPRVLTVTAQKPQTNQIALTAARPGDPEPYIFGRCVAEPILLTANDSGTNLYIDVLWSVGECDYIEYLIFDNTNEGRGDALGHVQHFEGATGQATSTLMQAAFGGSYDALDGKCHTVLRRRSGRDTLNFKAMIRGLKLFDPRTSPGTTVFSTNPALALARVLTDCGYTMDWTSVGDVADYCDNLLGSPQEKRWEFGLQIKSRQSLRDWVQTLAVYANCYVELQGGNAFLIADKPRSPNHTVSAADMLAGSVTVSRAGSRNVPQRVSVAYTPITETGPLADPPDVALAETRTAETSTSADAGTTSVLQLPGIQTYSRARRMATQIYNRSRNDLALTYIGFDDGLARTVGDVGTITNAQFGLSAATMTLISNKPLDRGRWQREYIDYDASNYLDTLYTEPAYNQVILLNPNAPPTGPTPTLTEELFTDETGTTYARMKIEFIGISWAYIQDYYVTAVGDDDLATVVYDGFVANAGALVTHTVYSAALIFDVTYTVNVYVHSNTDAYGSPGTASLTSALSNNALLDVGVTQDMHIYILDGDAKYATTSKQTLGSGQTWAERFPSTSPLTTFGDIYAANDIWFFDQVTETIFNTEIWDTGFSWSGAWRFIDLNVTVIAGTRISYVGLSEEVSPLSFTYYAGTIIWQILARYMSARVEITTASPIVPGEGLHVKLPLPANLWIGS